MTTAAGTKSLDNHRGSAPRAPASERQSRLCDQVDAPRRRRGRGEVVEYRGLHRMNYDGRDRAPLYGADAEAAVLRRRRAAAPGKKKCQPAKCCAHINDGAVRAAAG